jgi:hypothetical protein
MMETIKIILIDQIIVHKNRMLSSSSIFKTVPIQDSADIPHHQENFTGCDHLVLNSPAFRTLSKINFFSL